MLTTEKTRVLTNTDESLTLPTEEYSDSEILAKLHSLPTVEYPEAFIRELDEIAEEAKADLAAGRIFPMTADNEPRYYIDPNDYPDTTAFLNAIPGFVESVREMEKLPASAWEEWKD